MNFKKPDVSQGNLSLVGNSMQPTISPLDEVYYVAAEDGKYMRGDIIVYIDNEIGKKIAHRIISIDGDNVWTRGDNNIFIDKSSIKFSDIRGKIIYKQSPGKRKKYLYGGIIGTLVGTTLFVKNALKIQLLRLLYPLYDFVCRSRLLMLPLQRKIKFRYVSIKKPGGIEIQMFLGVHLIGVRLAGTNRWEIKPPYKLFIDDRTLPSVITEGSGGEKPCR